MRSAAFEAFLSTNVSGADWVPEATSRYVLERQNSDGGFFYARQAGTSSIEDTFYAVSILKMAGEEVPNEEKVVSYVLSAQRPDGSFGSLSSAAHALSTLSLLGRPLPLTEGYASWARGFLAQGLFLRNRSENSLEAFEAGAWALSFLGESPFRGGTWSDLLKQYAWPEGGYGFSLPTLSGTFHAARGAEFLRVPLDVKPDFVEACRVRNWGFSETPWSFPPTVSDTFHGIWLAIKTGAELDDAGVLAKRLKGYMNGNGGFREFPEIGISTLESTYKAIAALSMIQTGVRPRRSDLSHWPVHGSLRPTRCHPDRRTAPPESSGLSLAQSFEKAP
ncbi:MAG: prenyltransferase/squalene oxidase repeat-containing protein [TACK group archaeon]|nr:prenyltransferase/squalene oxidase repeat-containing protein [TACK group archaeon]